MTTKDKHCKYRLGIVDPGDLLKNIGGGSTDFIASILPYLSPQEVTIFGMGINGAIP